MSDNKPVSVTAQDTDGDGAVDTVEIVVRIDVDKVKGRFSRLSIIDANGIESSVPNLNKGVARSMATIAGNTVRDAIRGLADKTYPVGKNAGKKRSSGPSK